MMFPEEAPDPDHPLYVLHVLLHLLAEARSVVDHCTRTSAAWGAQHADADAAAATTAAVQAMDDALTLFASRCQEAAALVNPRVENALGRLAAALGAMVEQLHGPVLDRDEFQRSNLAAQVAMARFGREYKR